MTDMNQERILILNYLNAAYRLAFHEEAARTQAFLFRIISFLRYYLNDEIKIVRLKNELDYLRDFLQIHEESIGRRITRTLDFSEETAEVDLPAKTLILIVQELLAEEEEQDDGLLQITLRGYLEQEQLVVIFDSTLSSGGRQLTAKIKPLVESIKHLFEVTEPVFLSRQNQKIQICLRIPLMVGRNG